MLSTYHYSFLFQDFNAKFGGFGYVEIQRRYGRKQLQGVFGYLKAEYGQTNSHLPMEDVCSFGLVLLETITAKHPDDVMEGLESLDMRAPKSKSNRRTIKKLMDPRLKDNYSPKGAFSCMELALRCIECTPSMEEIVWRLEQIYALNK
ncbi:putative serine/threonine-protein kinase PIX13 [Bidens hawaiensis]|uniref:putative serine/threonine-protein kinase PIX13 n=1 Tax=Bidens hawaiensis TaxID=980011 RepID=UPI004048FB78